MAKKYKSKNVEEKILTQESAQWITSCQEC